MFRKKLKSKSPATPFAEHPYSDRPLLIVSGMGRSGTTILRNCVASHSQIDCHNAESNYIHDLMRVATENEEKPSRLPALPISEHEYWQLHRQFILHMLWPIDRLNFRGEPRMIATYSMLDPRASIGLSKAFKDVRVFYILRNGIEVVSSYQAFKAFEHLSFEQACKIWSLRRDMLQLGRSLPNFHLFRYEWLLSGKQFKTKLAEALRECGLDMEPKCLKPLDRRYHPTSFPGESKTDANDLSQRSDRWRLWSDLQREQFVTHCRQLMEEMGYPIPWLNTDQAME